MDKYGISERNLAQIIDIIAGFDFVEKAVIFGSRAKGTQRKYSDIDICLFGNLDSFKAEKVRAALDELNVIYEFDVLSYNNISNEALIEHIDRVGKTIYHI